MEHDYTQQVSFWKRLKSFVSDIQTSCCAGEEEKDMILYVCDKKIKNMEVDWTHSTSTSDEIIKGLQKNGLELKPEDKQLIIDKVYDAIISASSYESNGCDCGQVSCPDCCG